MDASQDDVATVRAAITAAQRGLVDREAIAEAVVLCAVAGEHLLVVGPPGTGKSEAVRRIAERLGGGYFEYLVGRFTEPNELFGPIDLRRLREGVVEVETAGMLPEAEVSFLDEVFLGSTAILNTLLGMLNEGVFRRGRTATPVALRVCVGASNALPDDPALAAFADRFLGRVFVDDVADARLEELLETGWGSGGSSAPGALAPAGTAAPTADPSAAPDPAAADGAPSRGTALAAIDRLRVVARGCDLSAVQADVGRAVRLLRGAGVPISDRRAVRSQRLVAAAAALDGRTTAGPCDLWVLPMIAPTAADQATAQDVLAGLVQDAASASLVHAAELFSRGRAARAARLAAEGTVLLDGRPEDDAAERRLRAEGTLREIDAGFGPGDLPDDLAAVRTRLLELADAPRVDRPPAA